ncbi:unnamed protein product [Vitrella brassicaformis CCMP3155]|uniref:peptidyl-tRNA hydrolase n=1 Tax=Vitrella brassicaformis (strain CCMP3155) TaxID=1169540 RepID=A0A0G4FBH7_VITBC|nr:unnamed protein product [Vitrella brassicaformis CCMP3155]|eukprot:CEM10220.1 unnamed protein product [Vitrella brassicaformis CCMP3155]
MVLVVRSDLKMGKGKIAAQCAHAAVEAYKISVKKGNPHLKLWEDTGVTKVAVRVDSEHQLLDIYQDAVDRGFVAALIADAGHTQIARGSLTVLGIGPCLADEADSVCGHLKLL